MKYYILYASFKDKTKDVRFSTAQNFKEAKLEFLKEIRPMIEEKKHPYDQEPKTIDIFECVSFQDIKQNVGDVFFEHIF